MKLLPSRTSVERNDLDILSQPGMPKLLINKEENVASMRYDVFVSYASQNKAWAKWTVEVLESANLRTFAMYKDMRGAQRFPKIIDDALLEAPIFLALFSGAFFASDWCEKEWDTARAELNEEPGRLLTSVMIEECRPRGRFRVRQYMPLHDRPTKESAAEMVFRALDRPFALEQVPGEWPVRSSD